MTFGYDENNPPEEPSVNMDGEPITREVSQPRQAKRTAPWMAVFSVFDDNPARSLWYLRPIEREAAKILFEKYGVEEVARRYRVVKKHRNEELCPQIDKPSDMLEKMTKMEAFLKRL